MTVDGAPITPSKAGGHIINRGFEVWFKTTACLDGRACRCEGPIHSMLSNQRTGRLWNCTDANPNNPKGIVSRNKPIVFCFQ